MDLNKIERLAEIINNKNLSEITIEENGIKITVKQTITNASLEHREVDITNKVIQVKNSDNTNININDDTKEDTYKIIKSPMVGIFYGSPSPDSDFFVKVGQFIKKGDVVCIIEAMKLMNEIVSDVDGEVVDICVENGEAVSFSQTIIKVK